MIVMRVRDGSDEEEDNRWATCKVYEGQGGRGHSAKCIFAEGRRLDTIPIAFENHENVENHEFPRFGNFVRPNGPDTGSTKLRNVFPVISVQSILSQLPYGAFLFLDRLFPYCF